MATLTTIIVVLVTFCWLNIFVQRTTSLQFYYPNPRSTTSISGRVKSRCKPIVSTKRRTKDSSPSFSSTTTKLNLQSNNNGRGYNSKAVVDPFLQVEQSELLDDLREEIGGIDGNNDNWNDMIVEPPIMFATENEEIESFDITRWSKHRSASRYFRLMPGVLFSVTTRRIAGTVSFLTLWSAAVQLYNYYATSSPTNISFTLPELQLPITPFELTAPVLGLLLVFRSNTSFDRFNLGSEASWAITNHFKSISRQILAFTSKKKDVVTKEERLAAYDIVDALKVLHGLIMKRYLRGKQIVVNPSKGQKFIRKALGKGNDYTSSTADDDDLSMTLLPMTPSAAISAISLGISRRLPSLDYQESTLIEEQLSELQSCLGVCEKLLRTPIPLGYTRYSVRFLWAWLFLLPFALVDTFYEFGIDTWWEDKPQPVLVLATLFICFIFVSIEDISVQIEEPFATLPLDLHQKWLERDINQMVVINRVVDDDDRRSSLDGDGIESNGNSKDGIRTSKLFPFK